jgi:Xaa-Pro dipeptidase
VKRRDFLGITLAFPLEAAEYDVPGAIRQLKSVTDDVPPISNDERAARIGKARRLMAENKIAALFCEPGSSLFYFTGIQWGRSERMFGLLLPARGEPMFIVPAFEESRARELIPAGSEIRTWEEDESPAERAAQALRDRNIRSGRLGIEETVRFFILDSLRKAAPGMEYVSADPVTAGCRVVKSPAELQIMTRANQVALRAVATAASMLRDGMSHVELTAWCEHGIRNFGCSEASVTITFGRQTALPHGSIARQTLREGDLVLIDAVCTLHGYTADITRTLVFGKPNDRQRRFWDLERKAQDAALAAVRPGRTCESVDAAARNVLTAAGLGPGYKLPGLPHRTGHGIGLDVHEWPYLVRGNKRRLEPGMCFSDEPMIVVPGEFGIRLEDCFYVTADGARSFTPQSPSIDQPFGA